MKNTMKRINRKNAVIVLAFFLFIGINIPFKTSLPYPDTEYYTVEVPYTDFNYYNYTVNESDIEEMPLDYIVLDTQYTDPVLSSPSYLWVIIKNNDTINGNFNVDFHIATKKDISIPSVTKISSIGNYISSGEMKTIEISYNETITEFKYDIIPPTKEVTKYRNVTMKRTETKYRKIQKSRDVIKFKNERLSVLQRFFPDII